MMVYNSESKYHYLDMTFEDAMWLCDYHVDFALGKNMFIVRDLPDQLHTVLKLRGHRLVETDLRTIEEIEYGYNLWSSVRWFLSVDPEYRKRGIHR